MISVSLIGSSYEISNIAKCIAQFTGNFWQTKSVFTGKDEVSFNACYQGVLEAVAVRDRERLLDTLVRENRMLKDKIESLTKENAEKTKNEE